MYHQISPRDFNVMVLIGEFPRNYVINNNFLGTQQHSSIGPLLSTKNRCLSASPWQAAQHPTTCNFGMSPCVEMRGEPEPETVVLSAVMDMVTSVCDWDIGIL